MGCDDLLQMICNGLSVRSQHGRLVYHPYPLQVPVRIESP